MAQIVEVLGVGEVEFPDGMSKEQMTAVLSKIPKPKFEPTAQNRGNVINSDVPSVVGSQANAVNAQPAQKPVTMMDRIKTLYEVPTAIAGPAITEPLAQAYGIARSIPEAIMTGQAPAPIGQKYAAQASQAMQYQPTSPESQAVLGTIGSALESAKIPPYIGNIGVLPSLQQFARPATNQMAGALRNEAGMIKETATPVIQRGIEAAKPIMAKAEEVISPVTTKMAKALRSEPKIDIAGIAKLPLH